jgi:hypothetical protein
MLKKRKQLAATVTLTAIVMALTTTIAARSDDRVVKTASWLDESKPTSWNKPGLSIPAAPRMQGNVDPRCRDLARTPELEEDKPLRDQGWDLVGAFQGGWQIVVIRGTAGYDGMCRPRQYQDFVFVGGVFGGTLSPQPMDSRTDGALGRVFLQSSTRLTAEYDRYEGPAGPAAGVGFHLQAVTVAFIPSVIEGCGRRQRDAVESGAVIRTRSKSQVNGGNGGNGGQRRYHGWNGSGSLTPSRRAASA